MADGTAVAGGEPSARRRIRAGRNLPAAIGVGLLMGAVVIASLFFWKPAFVIVLVAGTLVAVDELARALRSTRRVRVPMLVAGGGTIAVPVAAFVGGGVPMVAAVGLTVVAAFMVRMLTGIAGYVRDVTAAAFVVAYVPLLAGFAALLLRPHDGAWRVFSFVVVVVASDVGGYAAGVLFGRHPMAPRLSPKKSWEGLAGSLVGCLAVGAATGHYLLDAHWWAGVVFGAAVLFTATLGDLVESTIKRDLGVKDLGTLLPGHGGVMDRLDSLLPSALAAFVVLTLLVPVT